MSTEYICRDNNIADRVKYYMSIDDEILKRFETMCATLEYGLMGYGNPIIYCKEFNKRLEQLEQRN